MTGGIGPVPVSVSGTSDLTLKDLRTVAAVKKKDQKDMSTIVCRRHASHVAIVLSKAAHSGPSVCLWARAPCPLRVSCSGASQACSEAAGSCASVPPWVKTGLLARRSTHARTHCAPQRTFSGVSPLRTAARVLACALTRSLHDAATKHWMKSKSFFANALHDRQRGRVCAGHRRDHLYPDCSGSHCSGSFLL